jgi:Subtilase family/RTX calcium-binding nonapeptide repeat (4 copies)
MARGRSRLTSKWIRLCVATLACLGAVGGTALAAFPQDPPDDPEYDRAEPAENPTCSEESVNSEQHYLYDFMPACAPNATDPEDASGMSVNKAWQDFTTGNGRTVIAYIEGGINWHNVEDANELANKVFLNRGELPAPTTPVANGTLNAEDYSDTDDENGNGLVDPEDIIVRYSDGADDDHNGYVDDISGWDFYNDQNDPATLDSTYGHANNQMRHAAAETDNGVGEAGVCPKCMILPVKAGAEALDRTDELAQAWLYANDMRADVITSVTADLGYSSFMRQSVEKIWDDQRAVMAESSNDFNSTDHQGGMWWPHVLPGNGMVSNTQGLEAASDAGPAANAIINQATTTYRERSGETSWGTHNMFTAARTGGSTSESTPTVAGVLALMLAYGKEAADQDLISDPLTSSEAIQVVRDTASDVTESESHQWPSKDGWDLQYGYGRPNVHEAMQAIHDDEIPPVAWIDKPDWYALYDPTKDSTVPVDGHADAPRAPSYDWKLEFAPGGEPTDADFDTAAQGSGTNAIDGHLGDIDLSQVPQSFWNQAQNPFHISDTKTLETNEQYTVTIRLQVTDADGRVGEERRSIAVTHDPTAKPGFPKRIGPGGESQPVLADLRGTGKLAAMFGDADGRVHALGPSGGELSGFPVTTDPTQVEKSHPGINPGHEPVLANVAVGDLDHNGRQEIVVTSTTGRVYVWDEKGDRLSGWPKVMNTGVSPPDIPRPDLDYTRPPHQGATAPPVLVDLNGDDKLEIVQSAWDGHIYAWRSNGTPLDDWPIEVTLPPGHTLPSGNNSTVMDHKVDTPPAVAELDGDPSPELVVRSQYMDQADGGLQPGANSHLHAYNADGSPVPGFPIHVQALIGYYGSAQEFITEGATTPSTADVDGDDEDEIAFAPGIFSPTDLIESDGSSMIPYGPTPDATALSVLQGNAPLSTLLDFANGNLPEDVPVNFTTGGAFGRFGATDSLSYTEPGSGSASVAASLLTVGSGVNINNYQRAFPAVGGPSLPGFPAKLQGLDFLGAPVIADVTGDGQTEIVVGADSSAMHGYQEGGDQAADFPKFTTGWNVYGATTGDTDSDGKTDVLAATREGYVFAWETNGDADANQEWWGPRHDERNTGQYGADTRPPGALLEANVAGNEISFKAPGDDWYASGPVDHYEVVSSDSPIGSSGFAQATDLGPGPDPDEPGSHQSFEPPSAAKRYVAIRAVDDEGNVGRVASVDFRGPSGGGGGGGGGGNVQPGAACSNKIVGTAKKDRLNGTEGGDRIKGKRRRDVIHGRAGEDCIKGGRGRDRLFGNVDDDEIRGGKGRDKIRCGPGDDTAVAGRKDRVRGCERVKRPH